MKRFAVALAGIVVLAIAVVLALSLFRSPGKEVVVVTENAYPPLQFLDKSGVAVGWEYDAMAEIAKRLNITVKYENTSWDAMIPAVAAAVEPERIEVWRAVGLRVLDDPVVQPVLEPGILQEIRLTSLGRNHEGEEREQTSHWFFCHLGSASSCSEVNGSTWPSNSR